MVCRISRFIGVARFFKSSPLKAFGMADLTVPDVSDVTAPIRLFWKDIFLKPLPLCSETGMLSSQILYHNAGPLRAKEIIEEPRSKTCRRAPFGLSSRSKTSRVSTRNLHRKEFCLILIRSTSGPPFRSNQTVAFGRNYIVKKSLLRQP